MLDEYLYDACYRVSMDVERTHDKFYLKETYKDEPKEYFKFVAAEINEIVKGADTFSCLDIGCASGGFLYYLRKCFPKADLTGMDILQELLDKVNEPCITYETNKQTNKLIHTILADVSNKETLPSEKYDIVTMLGVIGIFDDFKIIFDNALSLVKPRGHLLVFGGFNPDDLDAIIKVKRSNSARSTWEPGWNLFSKTSIGGYLSEKSLQYQFKPFELNIDIMKRVDDPLRSWTVSCNGKRVVINGIQIIHHFYLLDVMC